MNIPALVTALPIVLWGMLGVFAVMLFIYALIAILTRATHTKK